MVVRSMNLRDTLLRSQERQLRDLCGVSGGGGKGDMALVGGGVVNLEYPMAIVTPSGGFTYYFIT